VFWVLCHEHKLATQKKIKPLYKMQKEIEQGQCKRGTGKENRLWEKRDKFKSRKRQAFYFFLWLQKHIGLKFPFFPIFLPHGLDVDQVLYCFAPINRILSFLILILSFQNYLHPAVPPLISSTVLHHPQNKAPLPASPVQHSFPPTLHLVL
jgi:hypothetical protein